MTSPRDHFPRTPRTIVFESLAEGRAHELASDLMSLYAGPLQIYYSATSFRSLGEPMDIVAGFFASRFSQPTWLADWRARNELDQIPLRRWLLNSLNFYLHEETRRVARDRRLEPLPTVDAVVAAAADAERTFERESARQIVARALERTRVACDEAGQSRHLEIFMRHFLGQVPYERLAQEHGLTPTQCAGMSRTVAAKLRRELASMLLAEGADPQRLDEDIGRLIEVLAA